LRETDAHGRPDPSCRRRSPRKLPLSSPTSSPRSPSPSDTGRRLLAARALKFDGARHTPEALSIHPHLVGQARARTLGYAGETPMAFRLSTWNCFGMAQDAMQALLSEQAHAGERFAHRDVVAECASADVLCVQELMCGQAVRFFDALPGFADL